MSENKQPIFEVSKLYVKDISLEVPHAPEIFLGQETQETQVDIGIEHTTLENNYYHVKLSATVTSKLATDNRTVYLCEVAQGGIFHIENLDAELDALLQVACPTIMFPYVSEAVANTISRAGFLPIHLTPINFDAMYQEKLAQEKNNSANA